jgi:hypothetical protein
MLNFKKYFGILYTVDRSRDRVSFFSSQSMKMLLLSNTTKLNKIAK